ncbi:MAG: ankyrin repeat domain-containing protein [Verrucomicrobia bacterium]|nr:ankyrin repeat domain-containing protein [Verrucomicrobiota bacterium]
MAYQPSTHIDSGTRSTFDPVSLAWMLVMACCSLAAFAAPPSSPDSTQDANGSTPLHSAVQHDDVAKVQSLLAAGADAKATNRYGVPPLHLACVNGNEAIVTALLDAGAEANTTLRGSETVLHTAARTGRIDPVKALLARGAKVDAADRKGQTPLMWAAADGHTEVVELLLKSGADRYARLKSGFTALLFAAREGRIGVVRALLKSGADANEAIETEKGGGKAPDNGTSALLLAVENGHFELAMELVRAGANPNDQRSGFTPLHTLTWVRKPNRGDDESGHPPPQGSGNLTSLQFARELVKHGADVNAPLAKGASGKGKLSTVGATPFLLASKTADVPLMKLLVELGANPKQPNKDGSTPLMAAAGLGCHAPTEEAGTEPECLEAVAYLLTLGADLNTVDANGETAMHGAAYKSLPKMVELLANKGAKIEIWNQKNKSGWTPLLIAEGFRPGNFKPSAETIAAIHSVMRAAGLTPPPPTPRPDPSKEPKGYEAAPGKAAPKKGKKK